jgi:P-type Cu+ transporter
MKQAATSAKIQYRIGGMACGFCVATIGKAIGRLPGVHSVNVNLAHEEALIEFDPARVAPEEAFPVCLRDNVAVKPR